MAVDASVLGRGGDTSLLVEEAAIYARHLYVLLRRPEEWLTRRVVACTIVDGDTLRFRVSIDFDLNECPEGRQYLRAIKHKNWRPGSRKLPLLLPIGLYPDPYVGFDLRDSAESRVSLLTKGEREAIVDEVKVLDRQSSASFTNRLGSGELAIAELPAYYSSGRGVLHYTYLRRWKPDKQPFTFRPPSPESGNSPRLFSSNWWRRLKMQLGWEPMKVAIPLQNVHFCDSFHIELHTPEEIRIHAPEIINENQVRVSEQSEGDKLTRNVPPSHTHALVHNKTESGLLAGAPLIFRAWIGLDRRGFTTAILILAIINALIGLSAFAIFLEQSFPISQYVVLPVQVIAATGAFTYLYIPSENGVSRDLYNPVRAVLVIIVAAGLYVAGALAFLTAHLDKYHNGRLHALAWSEWAQFGVAAFMETAVIVGTVILLKTWRRARDERVNQRVQERTCPKDFGWHVVG